MLVGMTSFSSNWVKDNKPNMSERIKQNIGPQQPLKPRIELAKNKIQAQNQKLETILEKLRSKEKSLFNQVVSALQRHDTQHGKMLSNEIAQVRKTIKMISQLKMALEQIQLRLESTIDLGDVMVAIGPAMGALTRVRSGLAGVMPEVDRELGEINGVFSDIMMSAGSMSNTSFAFDASGEEVDRILAEAGAVAEQRMTDSFPDVPIGSSSTRTGTTTTSENAQF
ncbi:putative SNF7 protein [Candidatus Nitrososphaera gargensis Ga9.2]|uniref:Putative SNF7 protein n=2 Tax=Candidatus Nitrososphaera gargensis TaxID=497727 RepID=K0IJ37_NITGG|nr:putative SNF7 protein [Candidatus Nitrososphaera gargensis Ga9.2]